jgi:DNA-binding NtrC family response regulator
VDDDSCARDALSRSFWSQRHRLLMAASAAEALEILQTQRVDVVVSDQQMPRTTGVELLEYIAQNHPATARVLLTGQATLPVALRAINEGRVCRLLIKPCPFEALRAAVDEAVELAAALSAGLRSPTRLGARDLPSSEARGGTKASGPLASSRGSGSL